jgi:hypothetical protein
MWSTAVAAEMQHNYSHQVSEGYMAGSSLSRASKKTFCEWRHNAKHVHYYYTTRGIVVIILFGDIRWVQQGL